MVLSDDDFGSVPTRGRRKRTVTAKKSSRLKRRRKEAANEASVDSSQTTLTPHIIREAASLSGNDSVSKSDVPTQQSVELVESSNKQSKAITCDICGISLDNLDLSNQQEHINKCLDSERQKNDFAIARALGQGEPSSGMASYSCALCAKDLSSYSLARRQTHTERCCERMETEAMVESALMPDRSTTDSVDDGASFLPLAPKQTRKSARIITKSNNSTTQSSSKKAEKEHQNRTDGNMMNEIYSCVMCGKNLDRTTFNGRVAHVKTCAKSAGISPAEIAGMRAKRKIDEKAEKERNDETFVEWAIMSPQRINDKPPIESADSALNILFPSNSTVEEPATQILPATSIQPQTWDESTVAKAAVRINQYDGANIVESKERGEAWGDILAMVNKGITTDSNTMAGPTTTTTTTTNSNDNIDRVLPPSSPSLFPSAGSTTAHTNTNTEAKLVPHVSKLLDKVVHFLTNQTEELQREISNIIHDHNTTQNPTMSVDMPTIVRTIVETTLQKSSTLVCDRIISDRERRPAVTELVDSVFGMIGAGSGETHGEADDQVTSSAAANNNNGGNDSVVIVERSDRLANPVENVTESTVDKNSFLDMIDMRPLAERLSGPAEPVNTATTTTTTNTTTTNIISRNTRRRILNAGAFSPIFSTAQPAGERRGRRRRRPLQLSGETLSQPVFTLSDLEEPNEIDMGAHEIVSQPSEQLPPRTRRGKQQMKNNIFEAIKNNKELYTRILLYEVLNVDEILDSLRLDGVNCSRKGLVAFFDEQGICYRTTGFGESNRRYMKRRG